MFNIIFRLKRLKGLYEGVIIYMLILPKPIVIRCVNEIIFQKTHPILFNIYVGSLI